MRSVRLPGPSLADLLVKIKSWVYWGATDLPPPSSSSCDFDQMPNMCRECNTNFTSGHGIKSCKFCNGFHVKSEGGGRKSSHKIYPSDSPSESPEPPSPSFSGESIQSDHLARYLESQDCGCSPLASSNRIMASFSAHASPVSVRHSPSRSDEEDAEVSQNHFCSPTSEYCRDVSDIDSSSFSGRLEFYSCKSVGSSPLDSPSRIDFTSYKVGHPVQQRQEESPLSQNDGPFDQETPAILRSPDKGTDEPEIPDDYSDDISALQNQYQKSQQILDFETNGCIWLPPPPEDENDEVESNFFTYDDDDDDVGDSGAFFSSTSSLSGMFSSKEKQSEGSKEPLRAVIHGHFRALVSQLLQGENIKTGKEDGGEDWLDIVTAIAWQAANFVKPDTSKGGSMDPGDYVKIKCIASGSPRDSTLVKGVVCTKNIKHKRMTTQYKNPRLLLLGGALEYQSIVNQLASFNTLVQQENDHIKMIMSKIEALRPNVVLVEKSVSPFAQEYLLAKDISLVLNVKKPLLERIARCTGALISLSIDKISTARLGHCELFRVDRVSEEHETLNPFNKKPSKTLMFFEGCPRRLGCTVLLRGACREELKKVKHVVQYAAFAAYHLSLETSFLADEGASLPKATLKHSVTIPERTAADNAISRIPTSNCHAIAGTCTQDERPMDLKPEHVGPESFSDVSPVFPGSENCRFGNTCANACHDDLVSELGINLFATSQSEDHNLALAPRGVMEDLVLQNLQDTIPQGDGHFLETRELAKPERNFEDEVSSEYFSATDTNQSILVSFSSRCALKGLVCERSRLLRIKFYGSFDKPLGRYLRGDLLDQTSYCRSCKEPPEAHVLCYTHQQGNLTINVRSLPSVKLPGERDGKIWMWHRCLRCAHIDGVPPATHRVVMSDAAWGLSFGKFLELSFSNHATANRVAPCGHSLQRDCLRFYGFGSMVAFFRYSPIDILNVHLPPSVLEFNGHVQQEWIRKEAAELLGNMEAFYAEISDVLDSLEQRSMSFGNNQSDLGELQNHILELKIQNRKERNHYSGMLQVAIVGSSQLDHMSFDILELNRLRRDLLVDSHFWDRQLYSLDSLLRTNSFIKVIHGDASAAQLKELGSDISCQDSKLDNDHVESGLQPEQNKNSPSFENHVAEDSMPTLYSYNRDEDAISEGEITSNNKFRDDFPSKASNLSERIDYAWTGTDPLQNQTPLPCVSQSDGFQVGPVEQMSMSDNHPLKKMLVPVRVNSFDSALRVRERIRKGLPPSSLYLSTLRSFHASGDYRNMVRDPVSSSMRTYSQTLPLEAQKLNLLTSCSPSFISSASHISGGARLLLPPRNHNDIAIGVYDNDPASIVSYALSSKEYNDWLADKSIETQGSWITNEHYKEESATSTLSAWQSFGSLDLDYTRYGSYGSEDASSSMGTLFKDSKRSPHLTISFADDSSVAGGKMKYSVTCYFTKQFDSLRKRCCPNEVDFVRSLSRCQRWSAQGGKSNVYFAKSLDERFIIKQVKKTELDSFEEFASDYFKYLTDSLSSGSPTCLAKILGIYQVTIKHLKGGKELKMDLMVMENLFFKRSIARVYDLKGSLRSRYNPDTTGTNKVFLDMNLVETLRTEPLFLGSKAKRSLERAIWNDTNFLACVDVMDYSLLVGVDTERKELVLGIIDFMRQYTWDKHLETWVKASGILGGSKNASPTIVSPIQYKKRFRKAMTSYFLTVPDQWSS